MSCVMSSDPKPNATREALNARRAAAVTRGVASATPIFAAKAENEFLWDTDGNRYIDFSTGIGVLATGHCHPRVIAAVRHQLDQFTHTAFQVAAYEPYIELAEKLNAAAPFAGGARSLLVTTGAEAVEAAVKIARIATGRPAVIAFSGAFHGRTSLGMALTGKVAPYKKGVDSAHSNVHRIPFPVSHQGVETADTLRALESLFQTDVDPERVAAIIIEPVQGEGGFHVAPRELLLGLRAVCDQHGITLIADEIQTGFGRTGRLFAIDHSGVQPDIVTLAKSLAGGFPLAAVVGRESIMQSVEPGGLGGTYGGSPIGCAAALAVLQVISDEGLLERAEELGKRIRARLNAWASQPLMQPIGNIRGLGMMLAFDVLKSAERREPDGAMAKRITARALERGLIVLSCGTSGETIRLLVPLTISRSSLDSGLDALDSALRLDCRS
jgi:4-aminobutyrate aminotransferase/(S)-3-amino-2-methylpropionate transaminase